VAETLVWAFLHAQPSAEERHNRRFEKMRAIERQYTQPHDPE
jgi:ribose 5-phosphate isomerase RpiB